MSFNRLNYDTCEYKQTLAQSIGPGHYQINTPPISISIDFIIPNPILSIHLNFFIPFGK